jgi:DoxX-like family
MSYVNSVTTTQQETAFFAARTTPQTKTMDFALWILQVLWGIFFSFTGFGKIMCYRPDVWNHTLHQPVAWFSSVPQGLFVFIGLCEFLGGVGLILPAMTGVKPKLTPFCCHWPDTGHDPRGHISHHARRVQLFCAHESGAGRSRRVHCIWPIDGQAYRAVLDQHPPHACSFGGSRCAGSRGFRSNLVPGDTHSLATPSPERGEVSREGTLCRRTVASSGYQITGGGRCW